MSPLVEAAGVELSYSRRGAADAAMRVLYIHGLAGDAYGAEPLVQALGEELEVIAYDRRGYGESAAPEPYEGTTVGEQTEDAATLIERLEAAPVLLVGDGFGALIALDLLLRHGELASGAVLAHPPLFALVSEGLDELEEQRRLLEGALLEHDPAGAVERWLGGRLEDPELLARARRSHRGFFADFAGVASFPISRRELRGLSTPVAVLSGEADPPHIRAAADALSALLPRAERRHDGDLVAAVASLVAAPPAPKAAPPAPKAAPPAPKAAPPAPKAAPPAPKAAPPAPNL